MNKIVSLVWSFFNIVEKIDMISKLMTVSQFDCSNSFIRHMVATYEMR